MNPDRFEELLKRAAGLDAPALGRGVLERAIRRRVAHVRAASDDEYHRKLEQSPEELQLLIDEVVVLETSFFRDAGAFTVLQEWVRDEWMKANASRTLRVLSVPSSTGEEPYSLAMALLDLGMGDALRFQIDAVDISTRALRHARIGVYGKGSFRGRSLEYRQRHFIAVPGGHEISRAVREHVEFKHGSILDSELTERRYDVVFCRNLLIYFDSAHQLRAMQLLLTLVQSGGLLFLGPAETFLTAGAPLQSLGRPMSFGFRRTEGSAAASTAVRAAPPLRAAPTRDVATAPRPVPSRQSPPPKQPAAEHAAASKPANTAGTAGSAAVMLAKAETLANSGKLAEAAQLCKAQIARFGTSTAALFLLGVVSNAMGDTPQAISAFRKVLYLEVGHEQALLHLSMLARDGGGSDRARQLDRRARALGTDRSEGQGS